MDKQDHEAAMRKLFDSLHELRQDTEMYKLALAIIESFVQQRPYDADIHRLLVNIKEAADDLIYKVVLKKED